MIYDATVCPQDTAYPTDLGLPNKAREITEGIIDEPHQTPAGKGAQDVPENSPKSLSEGGPEQKSFKKGDPERDQISASVAEKKLQDD